MTERTGTVSWGRIRWLAAAAALVLAPASGALERSETLRREFTLGAGTPQLVAIDNVFGSVRVSAHESDRVLVLIRQSVRARSEAAVLAAGREVALDERISAGRLELVQDGPFRCSEPRDARGERGGCKWQPDYEVRWDWEVMVPADVALEVKAVNDGEVVVTGVRGPVEAANVNGGVSASGLAAEATISSVNGDLDVEFASLPAQGGSLRTVNGEIGLMLPADAGAEVAFETLNGEVYSDFEVERVPQKLVAQERSGRGRSYRLGRHPVVRIGAGGPRFDCQTLNGDILVRSSGR